MYHASVFQLSHQTGRRAKKNLIKIVLLLSYCWISGQSIFGIHSIERNLSDKKEILNINRLSHENEGKKHKSTLLISKPGAYMGARFSNRRHGYVASVSTSKLCGKHVKRDVACSDEFPTDDTTLRVLKLIRLELASGVHEKPKGHHDGSLKVLCMLYTSQPSHSSKLNAIVNTWARDCDGFLAASNFTEIDLGAADLIHSGPETYRNMWQKVRSMWAYVYLHYLEEYDFFHICGDDTFVIMENMRRHLSSLHRDTSKPIFLGTPMRHKGSHYAAGGSGYTLNRAAVKVLVEEALDVFLTDYEDSREDVFVSSLLEKVDVKLTAARDENGLLTYMHLNPPTFVEYFSYEGNATLSGINKVSERTASIHVNYNLQGKSRMLYSETDIVEMIYRYHDILQGKCDADQSKT